MWDEDNEAVEGEQTEVAEATEAAEPVETADAPEPAEPVEAASEAAPEVFDWNGELESLKQEQWFNGLDENLRQSMLHGFESKYQNWARG